MSEGVATGPNKAGAVWAGLVFGACVLLIFLFPFAAIGGHSFFPIGLTNFLYFFPQVAFPYRGLVTKSVHGSMAIFSPGIAAALSIAQWVLLAIVFARAARGVKIRYLFPLASAAIFVAVILVPLLLSLFGTSIELDGP
jgi:hypothetical protein